MFLIFIGTDVIPGGGESSDFLTKLDVIYFTPRSVKILQNTFFSGKPFLPSWRPLEPITMATLSRYEPWNPSRDSKFASHPCLIFPSFFTPNKRLIPLIQFLKDRRAFGILVLPKLRSRDFETLLGKCKGTELKRNAGFFGSKDRKIRNTNLRVKVFLFNFSPIRVPRKHFPYYGAIGAPLPQP